MSRRRSPDRAPAPGPARRSSPIPLLVIAAALGCSGGEGRSAEDAAFSLLEESQVLRNAGDFEGARERLEQALGTLAPDGAAAAAIRDELRYSLPMARARRLARDGDTGELPALLAPVRDYIRDHPDRFTRSREIADLLDGAGSPPAEGETAAFALLEESRAFKAAGDLGAAAVSLERAAALVPTGSVAGRAIRDELYYFLPVERARQALTRHDPAAVEAALAPVSGYLEGHPRRFELIRQVEALAESARMLRHAIGADARARLRGLEILLITAYMETGECPRNVEELAQLVSESGLDGSDAFVPESLARGPGGCTALFREVGGAGSHELHWP